MKTFVPFPNFTVDVPRFLFQRTMVVFIRKFAQWCFAEYFAAINYYRSIGDERSARLVEKHFTVASVAAKRPEFKKIVALMTSDIWNSLSRDERKLLNSAYQLGQ